MMDRIAAADLPPRLAELADLIGLPATLRLVDARGGTRFYVPDHAAEDHWLARLIGLPALQQLVQARARDTVELDRASGALRAVRDRSMLAQRAQGVSSASLALQYGLTQRQVFNILARAAPANLNQLDMFTAAD